MIAWLTAFLGDTTMAPDGDGVAPRFRLIDMGSVGYNGSHWKSPGGCLLSGSIMKRSCVGELGLSRTERAVLAEADSV